MRHLRQKHRAEFSGADQRDLNRFPGRAAGVEQAMKVHGRYMSYLSSFRGAPLGARPESILTVVIVDSGLNATRRPGMTLICVASNRLTPPPGDGCARA